MTDGAHRKAARDARRSPSARSAARLAAVQALYQMDMTAIDMHEVIAEFEAHRLGQEVEGSQYCDAEAAFFRDIVEGVVREQRQIDPLIDRHLDAHEAVMIAGMLVVLLPAAEQSLAPGGGRFGLELIAAGLILLAAGLGLSARWLVVGGVITLTTVAVRWLVAESSVPYWLTLGLAGMALLGFGMLLLLERDRWDRIRARVRRWWTDDHEPIPAP